jgi:hypothetical protein
VDEENTGKLGGRELKFDFEHAGGGHLIPQEKNVRWAAGHKKHRGVGQVYICL